MSIVFMLQRVTGYKMISVKDIEKKQIIFVFLNYGEKISFSNDNIVIKDDVGKIKHQSTCYRLFILFVVGHLTVTTGLIQRSHKFGFVIYFMTPTLRIYDVLGIHNKGNVLLRKHQYEYNDIEIAKWIVFNKIANQRTLLNLLRDKNYFQENAIKKLDGYINDVQRYSGNLSGLLGYEGSAARTYFSNYFDNINWQGRKPRIKSDYVNSTLDIGYTILFNIIDAMLNIFGFDNYCGVLHRQFYMRKSLTCDLVEPFRVLVDKQVRKAVNLGQIKAGDFTVVQNRYLLNWDDNALYVRLLLKPIMDNRGEIFKYIQDYYRAFMKQKPIEQYPFFRIEDTE